VVPDAMPPGAIAQPGRYSSSEPFAA